MKELKVYVCAGIFIALTAIKIISPELSGEIAEEIKSAMQTESTQTQSVISLGASLTDGTFFDTFKRNESERYISAGGFKSNTPTPAKPSETPTPTPTPTPVPETPEPTPKEPEKVTAFLESQKAYADYNIRDNVSYDYPDTGFEYTNPVEGATSSGFGYRMHPLKNQVKFHYGTDFAVPEGSEIRATIL